MPSTSPSRPDEHEYAPDFARYIRLVPDADILQILEEQLADAIALLEPVSETQGLTLHAPYTWTLKQVVGHVTDCERVFGYRALRLARNDATPLPSFDEMHYMQFVDFNAWPIAELLEEFALVCRSHLHLFRHLTPDAWLWRGTVNNHPATCRALAFAIAGHARHHLDIVRKRLAAC
jgi:hypothetical protein